MTLAQTSLFAFEAVRLDLSNRQREIYALLDPDVGYTNAEIARLARLPINCVTPRVLELRKKGLLVSANVRTCTITGNHAEAWRKS